MTFFEHLEELRGRLIRALWAIALGAAVACWFAPELFHWLMQPVLAALPEGARKLHPTSVMEKFTVYLKVGLYGGIFAASPAILFQAWKFIAPALYRKEKRFVVPFVATGSLFFVAGAVFCYYIVLPAALQYLIGVGSGDDASWVEPFLSMNDQLTFVLALELAFGLIFEMPLIITALAMLGVVTAKQLADKRRYAILGNTIAAAIITPTGDPLNLAIMAVPMCLMYEVGIWGARIFGKKKGEPQPTGETS
ncbi:MAG: twin-arginine translocase subunit TatC [Deltaproteobacteria bacterium]